MYCDASGIGLGFWYPSLRLGFYCDFPTRHSTDIFYHKALCVAVFTDSLDSVAIFNSLAAGAGYNDLLRFVVDLVLATSIDFQVFHISGDKNTVADHCSCNCGWEALACVPNLQILPFEPPQNVLGVSRK